MAASFIGLVRVIHESGMGCERGREKESLLYLKDEKRRGNTEVGTSRSRGKEGGKEGVVLKGKRSEMAKGG